MTVGQILHLTREVLQMLSFSLAIYTMIALYILIRYKYFNKYYGISIGILGAHVAIFYIVVFMTHPRVGSHFMTTWSAGIRLQTIFTAAGIATIELRELIQLRRERNGARVI